MEMKRLHCPSTRKYLHQYCCKPSEAADGVKVHDLTTRGNATTALDGIILQIAMLSSHFICASNAVHDEYRGTVACKRGEGVKHRILLLSYEDTVMVR